MLLQIKQKCTSWRGIKKSKAFELSPFIGQSYFDNGGAQLYLIS